MDTLSIPEIFYLVFTFCDLKDIYNLIVVNRDFNKLLNDDEIWRMKYFKDEVYLNDNKYFKYVRMFNLKKSRHVCSICNDYMNVDIVLTIHNCNPILKKCINCNDLKCKCSDYVIFHEKCLLKTNFKLYECPFCFTKIPGYSIKYNI